MMCLIKGHLWVVWRQFIEGQEIVVRYAECARCATTAYLPYPSLTAYIKGSRRWLIQLTSIFVLSIIGAIFTALLNFASSWWLLSVMTAGASGFVLLAGGCLYAALSWGIDV